jgi:hypothetical protein
MNRTAAALVLCAFLAPVPSFAQSAPAQAQQQAAPAATASHTFNDPAMSFTAPADFVQVPMNAAPDPSQFEKPTVVAAFVKNYGRPGLLTITITMENFEGNADGFDQATENTLRNQADGVFIKKSPTKLPNGMPAYWQEITIGSGFNELKRYQYIWADGVRGVQLALMGRYGAVGADEAKKILADVSAVAFPRYRY